MPTLPELSILTFSVLPVKNLTSPPATLPAYKSREPGLVACSLPYSSTTAPRATKPAPPPDMERILVSAASEVSTLITGAALPSVRSVPGPVVPMPTLPLVFIVTLSVLSVRKLKFVVLSVPIKLLLSLLVPKYPLDEPACTAIYASPLAPDANLPISPPVATFTVNAVAGLVVPMPTLPALFIVTARVNDLPEGRVAKDREPVLLASDSLMKTIPLVSSPPAS